MSLPTNCFMTAGDQLCAELKQEEMVYWAALAQVLSVFSGVGQGREEENQDKMGGNDPWAASREKKAAN